MTSDEFNKAAASGQVSFEAPDAEDTSSTPNAALPSTPIEQFIPLLTQLESVQECLTAAPTFIPQTFQEQIQFVFTGGNYYVYLYFNNQWNAFNTTSGGGGSVAQILAGSGISISPAGGTGTVTISCTITDATLPVSNITTNNVSTSQHGFAPILPNDATKYFDGTGAYSVPPGTSGSFAVSTGNIPDVNIGANFHNTTPVNNDTVVTHGLGTTPKIIKITINDFDVSANVGGTGTHLDAFMLIEFNVSGTAMSGITLYNSTGASQLIIGGLTTTFSLHGSTNGSTMTLSLVSIGATTFTFRLSYYADNGVQNIPAIGATGINYQCMG